MNEDLATRIARSQFQTVRLREGYQMGQVDQFLDELLDAVTAGQDVGARIAKVRFHPVRLRKGYDMPQVDRLLAEVVTEMRKPGRRGPADTASQPVGDPEPDGDEPVAEHRSLSEPTPSVPGVVTRRDGLLSRWRREDR